MTNAEIASELTKHDTDGKTARHTDTQHKRPITPTRVCDVTDEQLILAEVRGECGGREGRGREGDRHYMTHSTRKHGDDIITNNSGNNHNNGNTNNGRKRLTRQDKSGQKRQFHQTFPRQPKGICPNKIKNKKTKENRTKHNDESNISGRGLDPQYILKLNASISVALKTP